MKWVILLTVATGCLVTFRNWRWGVPIAIVLGLLQDPVRKAMPGAPTYMVLVSLPVWVAIIVSALANHDLRIRTCLSQFPRLTWWGQVFACYLIVPAIISATYGRNTWQITLLGGFVFTVAFFVIVVGWQYPGARMRMEWLPIFYAIVAGVLLVGGPLEFWGWGEQYPAIGTHTLGHQWVTHRTGTAVHMLAGFFRGPDVMGWHASLVLMISLIMAYRSRGAMRIFWIAWAAWALLSIWLCGRRKMLAMLPVFVGSFYLLLFRFKRMRNIVGISASALIVIGLGGYVITSYYGDDAVAAFYMTVLDEVDTQIYRHGFASVTETIRQAGFWGYGLGMSQQGVHNIDAEKPRLWQESGPSKLFAELGVPGALLFLYLCAVFLMTAYHVVARSVCNDTFDLTAGLWAILIANLTSAVVSAQIYGDPLVLFLLAFMTGLLLSSSRIEHAAPTDTKDLGG